MGPLELNQQSWSDSSSHLEMACLIAQGSEHRVAVLVDTPAPEAMFEDVHLMVRSVQPDGDDCVAALLGAVTANGEMQLRQPFAAPRVHLKQTGRIATVDAIPSSALGLLTKAVESRTAGLLLFGSSEIDEHPAVEFVAASLTLTEHAGPAARIMPRHRSTPAKDWQVPDAIKELPFLPSIESAYEQGYRRMVFAPSYTPSELLLEFSKDVLLISGTYGSDVDDIFMSALRFGGLRKEGDLLAEVIAILGVKNVPTKLGIALISDLYLQPPDKLPMRAGFKAMFEHLRSNRAVKWEDGMEQLLSSGNMTSTAVKKALPRNRAVADFLSRRGGKKQAVVEPV